MRKTALVLGGNGGIGLALVKNLLEKDYKVISTYRDFRSSKQLNCLDHINHAPVKLDPFKCDDYASSGILDYRYTMVINTIGVLEVAGHRPEKSLKDISFDQMQKTFLINSFLTPFIGKMLKNNFEKESKFVVLSAKVGSIGDNQIGGWYSYRASKSALNMFLKTMSIEFSRGHNKVCVLAIHPGTTETSLSKNYIKNTSLKIHSSEKAAENILNVISSKTESDSGKFFSWDNKELPW